jgi:predicted O-methyltransferase YrrM
MQGARFVYKFIDWSARTPPLYRIVRSLLSNERRLIVDLKLHSMLHWDALLWLYRFAATLNSNQIILEIGAFTGGATVTMALARNAGQSIAIEVGGERNNSVLPSKNILGDLRKFLTESGVNDRVHVIEGWSNDPRVCSEVCKILAGREIGLLLIDADGEVARDCELYKKHLSNDAIVVCDDYIANSSAQIKADIVKPWIDEMVSSGVLEKIRTTPWGTWFGRWRGGGERE